jgi:predicted phosphodiesterase
MNVKVVVFLSVFKYLRKIYRAYNAEWDVPNVLIEYSGEKILHISDTPTSIYRKIYELVDLIKPSTIIHTGDLVDNIKLEITPGQKQLYIKFAQKFLDNLSSLNVQKIFLVPGNHDSLMDLILSDKVIIMQEGSKLCLSNLVFSLSHKNENLLEGGDYYLFGHNFEPSPFSKEENVSLNGISYINIILLPNGEVFKLQYPWFTNNDRSYRRIMRLT